MTIPQVPEIITPGDYAAEEAKFSLAVVIDGVVYSVINTDGQSAARFLAQPTFVQVDRNLVSDGDLYDSVTGTFSKPTA